MTEVFKSGNVYTFNTLSPAFLGATIKNARVEVTGMTAKVARQFEPIDTRHASIYPTLPPGTPNDINSYVFYLFTAENGAKLVLADKWIDPESIVLVQHVKIKVEFPMAALGDDVTIRNALNAAGLSGYAIQVDAY